MKTKILLSACISCACLLVGMSIGFFWLHPRQKASNAQTAPQCDVGPLYYQAENSVAAESDEMEKYPTKDRYYGRPAPVDFRTSPQAKEFYTRLTEGASKGPNAAGHYTVVQIGWTGNGFYTYVIDARTGKIVVGRRLENSAWRFAIDSDLIITDGIANPAYFHGPPSNEAVSAWCLQPKLLLLRDGELKEIGGLPWMFGDASETSNGIADGCLRPKEE